MTVFLLRKLPRHTGWTLTKDYTICKLTKWLFRSMCHHVAVLSWLTWNKEHDPSSKGAVEPLKSGEVGKGEDPCDDASEAWHGGEDHESTCGIPVSWWGAKQGREHTVKICAGRSTTNSLITTVSHYKVIFLTVLLPIDMFLIIPMHWWTHTAIFNTAVTGRES